MKKYLTIRDLKQTTNFARIRGLGKRSSSPQNPEGEGVSLQDKCEIINRNFFGENIDAWKNSEQLLEFLSELAERASEKYEHVNWDTYYNVNKSIVQLAKVIKYLSDKDSLRPTEIPTSLAVYEPSKTVATYFLTGRTSQQKLINRFLNAIGNLETSYVEEMLRSGKIDPNVENRYGTALSQAAEAGDIYMVEALVEAGADVNSAGEEGFPPLHSAKTPEIALYLIDNGADPKIKDIQDMTAFEELENANYHRVELIPYFYEIGDPNTFEDIFVDLLASGEVTSKELADKYKEELEYVKWWEKKSKERRDSDDYVEREVWNLEPYKRFTDIAKRWTKIKNPAIKSNKTFTEQFALFLTVAEFLHAVLVDDED